MRTTSIDFWQQQKGLSSKAVASMLFAMAVMALTFLSPITAIAEGETISGGTNITGDIDNWLEVDGISVSGTTLDPISVSLSVDSGNLRLTSDSGITYYNGVTLGRSLNITGLLSDVNAALGSLQYLNTEVGTVSLTASLSSPGEVFYPTNGHIYEAVFADGGITADDARIAAEGRTKYGSQGYLATITSAEENSYVGSRLTEDGWFGAKDGETEGDWKWLSGPEANTSFWSGISTGGPVGGRYANWASGEPNNGGESGDEDCAQFYNNSGGWNDLSCSNLLQYYIVEYGADGDLPAVSSTSINITTNYPVGDLVPVDSCEDIITITENPLDYRYDDISLTQDIDCAGDTISPMFNSSDELIGRHTFRGTFDGNGHTINNLVINETYENVGLIRFTETASFTDVVIGNGVSITGTYCIGGLVGEALNTGFTDITSSAVVSSTDGTSGGVVGCLRAEEEGQSSVSDSTVTAAINSSQSAGGVVGDIETGDQSATTIENNVSNVVFESNDRSGGIVGEIDVDDNAILAISNNINNSVMTEIDDDTAGIVGYLYIDESASVSVDSNTNNGSVTGHADEAGGIIGSLFVEEEDATVDITNNTNNGDITSSDDTVGGIIGEVSTGGDDIQINLVNCINTGEVQGDEEVGGLIGISDSINMSNSSSTGNVSGYIDPENEFQVSAEIGGLVGDADSTVISNSYATGQISGDSEVGGLVGFQSVTFEFTGSDPETGDDIYVPRPTTIRDSYFEGVVQGNDEIGGLVGDNSGGLIERSYADADVVGVTTLKQYAIDPSTGEENFYEEGIEVEAQDVGGLVGEHETETYGVYNSSLDQTVDTVYIGKISESFATGTVSGAANTGGIAGNIISGLIKDSYSRSTITVNGGTPEGIGGAIGRAQIGIISGPFEYYNDQLPSIDKVYATGSIASNSETTGGLVGQNVDDAYDITNSFWDTQSSGVTSSDGGTGKTSSEMRTIDTYINLATDGLNDRWNFGSIWGIYASINDGYPCLSWSSQSCNPNSPDADEDGISDAVEAAAPNNGDANNDGTPDSQQTNVASFVNSVTGRYAALEVNAPCSITEVGTAAEAAKTVQDSGFSYPVGLMNFNINCGTNGFTANIRKFYYGVNNTSGMIVRKHNPNTGAYFNLTGSFGTTIAMSNISGQSVVVVSYQITDGQQLDIDSLANGVIVDPSGLAVSAVGSPNTGIK